MSWVKENCISIYEYTLIKILKIGIVPQHLAVIMDGNRRFSKKHNLGSSAGHYKGFDKLSETIKWCLELGVPQLTVYAFSIENFKRSQEEVNRIMDLSRDKFQGILDDIDNIHKWGIRICVFGRLTLLPDDVQALVSRTMLLTKHNTRLQLNIAFAYTGRDEICRAAADIIEGVKNNDLSPEDIDTNLISETLDLGEPDLLIRTSGEVRLSDFMLWQVPSTVIYFCNVLWPEFTAWDFMSAVIHFQRNAPPVKEINALNESKLHFLNKLESKRWEHINQSSSKFVSYKA